jgi:Na+/melibiose symporter-like transporter
MGLKKQVAETLGVVAFPGSARWTATLLIDATGTGLMMPITVLYFTVHLGMSAASVGLGLTVGGLVTLAVMPAGGVLIDHFGSKGVLVGAMGLAALAYGSYGLVRGWPAFVIAVTAAQIASTNASTARKTLVSDLAPDIEARRTMLASQRSVSNIGFGIGGLLATVALAIGGAGYLAVVYGDAMSFVIAIAFVLGIPVPRPGPSMTHRARPLSGLRRVLRDRRYLALTAADLFGSFYIGAWEIAVPLWVVRYTHAPAALVGLLFTMNTGVVVLLQVRVSGAVNCLTDATRAYRQAAGLMVLCSAVFLLAHYADRAAAIGLLVIGALGLVGVEMLASASEWITSMELAPAEHRGSYLSTYSLGNSLQDAVAPTVTTSALLLGAVYLWPLLGVLACSGMLASSAVANAGDPSADTEPGLAVAGAD